MKRIRKDTLCSLLSLIFVFFTGLFLGYSNSRNTDELGEIEDATITSSAKLSDSSKDLEEMNAGQPLIFKEWLEEKTLKHSDLLIENLDQMTPQEVIEYHQEMLDIPDTNFSISYENLITKEAYNYREYDLTIVASTSKFLIAMVYIDLMEEGKIELDSPIAYSSAYYQAGAGAITNDAGNRSSYPLDKVIKEMIIHSDNTATMMLKNYYRNHFGSYEKKLQELLSLTEEDISQYDLLWNRLNTHYLKEGLKLAVSNSHYHVLIELMLEADQPFFLSSYVDENMAVKYGQLGAGQHDTGIYYIEDEPIYLLVVLTNQLTREQADKFMGRINLNLATQALYKDYLHTFK